ncbi:MAG: nitrite reductase, copper-containing [Rhizobiales bacterium]|nr:copper-containing nitrite reductase [Hyphomicrobiales bacterium]NRB14813.1 nitrite reductase, copper-containing [Hyphomicrobiales bacterium]
MRSLLKTKISQKTLAVSLAMLLATTTAYAVDVSKLEVLTPTLLAPPLVMEHNQVAQGEAKLVKFELTIEEKLMEIDEDGTKVWAMTFNGTVPGPMMVVHEGDYVEIRLINPATNSLEHNIDLHAATGALGGGGLTHVSPGEEVTIRFKANKAGVYVYHCAPGGAMIPWHVVSGMNGAIMVLPREGLTDKAGEAITYDKAYYIGEQDFYIPQDEEGEYKTYDSPSEGFEEMMEVMNTLTPTHEVFNGAVGAITGDNAMTASVGETVLFLHSQANRDTRPHLIGGHGDYVWEKGNFGDDPMTNLETWAIPGGAAGAALYTFQQPGVYAYVNHNLIEAVLKGATAHVVVDGEWNNDLLEQISAPADIQN